MAQNKKRKKSWRLNNWPFYLFDDGKWWEMFKHKKRCRKKFDKYPQKHLTELNS